MCPSVRCPNLAVKEAEDDETIEEEEFPVKAKKVTKVKRKKQAQCKLSWIGEPAQVCYFSKYKVTKYLFAVCFYIKCIFLQPPSD